MNDPLGRPTRTTHSRKRLMMTPKLDLPTITQRLRATAAWIDSTALRILSAEEPQPERGNGSRPILSRPTELAAVARAAGERDWLQPEQHALLLDLSAMAAAAGRVTDRLESLHALLPEDRGPAPCTTPHCPNEPAAGRAGKCEPCRVWLRRHPEAETVPTSVLARRRGYVGPETAGGEAA